METSSFPADAPAPRLCHVVKRPDFEGFGFNLFAGKVKPGQFIGKVDPNSPAEEAGLRPGDRIIEVNGSNIGNENHKQVVQRIKLRPNETELLVVDDETDEYYSNLGVVIKGTQSNVIRTKSRAPRKISSSEEEEEEEVPIPSSPAIIVNGGRKDSVSSSSSEEDLSNAPIPRLCHVVKWNQSDGFGFHLLADKQRKGQFIGKVDPGSAAEGAGLQLGDRIIEVNGACVIDETHKQVVQRIKNIPNETKLLVIDPVGQAYYTERNIIIKSSMPNVKVIKTPAQSSNRPTTLKLNDTTAPAIIEDTSSAPAPRLCHIIKWRPEAGFGFHLLADKKRNGHFIGKVDVGTPAEAAGLKVSDRIIEVNGSNVTQETHKQIVERIKAVANETKLLVVDPEADAYYQDRGLLISGTQSNVVYLKTPVNTQLRANKSRDESSASSPDDDDRVQLRQQQQPKEQTNSTASPVTPSSPNSRPLSMATLTAAAASGLDLNMSAAELRARLAARKKYDPKHDSMDLRRKHEIVQTM